VIHHADTEEAESSAFFVTSIEQRHCCEALQLHCSKYRSADISLHNVLMILQFSVDYEHGQLKFMILRGRAVRSSYHDRHLATEVIRRQGISVG
jgi:hypothetical protein